MVPSIVNISRTDKKLLTYFFHCFHDFVKLRRKKTLHDYFVLFCGYFEVMVRNKFEYTRHYCESEVIIKTNLSTLTITVMALMFVFIHGPDVCVHTGPNVCPYMTLMFVDT